MSLRRRMRLALLAASAVPGLPSLETHALVFDGVGDYGYAPNGVAGVGDTWSLVLKVNGRHSTAPKYFGHLYDDNATTPRHNIDGAYAQTDSVSIDGRKTDANLQYQHLSVVDSDRTGVQVIVIVHRNVPTRRVDYYITRNGITLGSGGGNFSGGGEARTPLHVAVAAALQVIAGVHTPIATTFAPSHLIASAVINGVVTEAEAKAYSLADNALEVWPDAHGYWPMALVDSGAVADQGVNGQPMTIVGPTAADLEAL